MEKIGLQAVMEMAGFTQGINKYNSEVDKASGNTENKAGMMSGALGKMGSAIGGVAKLAAGAAVGGFTALVGVMTGSIVVATKWADTVDNVGDVLGTTAEESSALAVAAKTIGGDVSQLTSQMAILTRGLFDAKGEIGPTGLVLQNMGVAFQDANGKMLPTTEILQSVADKIGNMPDGLEKTQLMMDLFGKSGKDMSDMMGILANGGMEAMNQKAKDLGLSMSEEGTAGAIQFGRSMNDLKMMGQGLMVTIGNELMPVLQPLIESFMKWAKDAMPSVKQAIQDAIPVIQTIAKWIGDNLIPIVKDIVDWFVAKIPPAVEKAVAMFKEHFLPTIQKLWEFIQDPLLPTLGAIAEWLLKAIGKAIEWAVPIIGKLTAAYVDVYTYIFKHLLPIFADIIDWLEVAIGTAIEIFKPIWGGIKEAFSDVWTFISEDLYPIFEDVAEFLKTGFDEGIRLAGIAWGKVMEFINPVIQGLKDIIQFAKDALYFLGLLEKKEETGGGLGSTIGPLPPGREIPFMGGLGGFLTKIMQQLSTAMMIKAGSGLASFAGAILGRFQQKITGPLEEQQQALVDRIEWLKELQAQPGKSPEEIAMYNQQIAAAQKEYTLLTIELNKQKEKELKLQEQLNDLAFLQAQMTFLDFLRENELDMAQILGNLQLGLNLDLPAFMDAITRALAALIANLGAQVGGTPSDVPTGFMGGNGFVGGGGMAVYNNQAVTINMNVALNNGMDYETFKIGVLEVVTGALR